MTLHALLSILGFGLLMGVMHVAQGPDHLAALLPISAGQRWKAAWLGARWGIGHSSGVVVVSLLAVALKDWITDAEDPFFHGWGMPIVGIMLLLIGALGIRRAMKVKVHVHSHTHGSSGHSHPHTHASDGKAVKRLHIEGMPHGHTHGRVAFFAGIVHGVTGPAHILGVAFAVMMPDWLSATTYLFAFCLGAIASMVVFATFIGVSTAMAASRAPGLIKGFMWGTAIIAIAVGLACIILPAFGYPIDLTIFEPDAVKFGLSGAA